MMGPVSGTGRAMMASLQQAIAKGMPPDQAVQYVKSMATQGVAPLADLYSMMNQFQRLQQQQVKPPQTPPTIKDQLNMATQQQQMQPQQGNIQQMQARAPAPQAMDRGLGAIDAGRMEYPQFADGGIVSGVVAFEDGGTVHMANGTPPSLMASDPIIPGYALSPFGMTGLGGEAAETLTEDPSISNEAILSRYEKLLSDRITKKDSSLTNDIMALSDILERRGLSDKVDQLRKKYAPSSMERVTAQKQSEARQKLGFEAPPAAPTAGAGTTRTGTSGGRRIGAGVPTATTTAAMPTLPDTPDEGLSPFIKMIKEAQKTEGIGGASEKARKMLEEEAAEEKRLTPEQKRMALAQAGFAMAEAYSRRGRERVSGLGGLAEAGKSYTSSLQKINNELRDAARSRRRETIALDRADELQAAGNIQAAVNMRESAKADTFRRTELAVRQLESKLDRDLRMRLGMAQIGAQNLQTYATIKQKAIADYSDYVSNLSTDPRFAKLDEAQQNEFLKQAYERIVNSAVSDLGGGGGGSFPGFSLVNPKK